MQKKSPNSFFVTHTPQLCSICSSPRTKHFQDIYIPRLSQIATRIQLYTRGNRSLDMLVATKKEATLLACTYNNNLEINKIVYIKLVCLHDPL